MKRDNSSGLLLPDALIKERSIPKKHKYSYHCTRCGYTRMTNSTVRAKAFKRFHKQHGCPVVIVRHPKTGIPHYFRKQLHRIMTSEFEKAVARAVKKANV